MGRMLYVDCPAGISGDMFVAAMVDLGVSEDRLLATLNAIPVEGFQIKVSRTQKASIDVCDFDVALDHEHEAHDHDMGYLFGHTADQHQRDHDNEHSGYTPVQEHDHELDAHGHAHQHEGAHEHAHVHRHLSDVYEIIDATPLTPNANQLAKRMFKIIAHAEAKAHGSAIEEVHFHEVGAIDSIVDIIAAAFCVDDLGVDDVYVSSLSEGRGTVRCQHGIIPIPVPAVMNIAEDEGLSLSIIPYEGEFVTPTGAAIAAAIKTRTELPKSYRIVKSGMGGGKREYAIPTILRAFIIESDDSGNDANVMTGAYDSNSIDYSQNDSTIWKLEADVDDCTGEQLGFAMDLLFEAGAREVHYVPIFMKKNRPGYQIEVVCDEATIEGIEDILFTQTTTIGIRRSAMQRTVLERRIVEAATPWGKVQAKQVMLPDGSTRAYPEYDSVAAVSRETGVAFMDVYHAAYAGE